MTATFRSQPELDATWQAVQAQAAEAQATGADVNRLIERDAEAHNARALEIRAAREEKPVKPFASMFAELAGELMHDGYSDSWLGYANDAYILAGMGCTKCNHHGLNYHPFRQIGRERTSYRPLAECANCGYTFEF